VNIKFGGCQTKAMSGTASTVTAEYDGSIDDVDEKKSTPEDVEAAAVDLVDEENAPPGVVDPDKLHMVLCIDNFSVGNPTQFKFTVASDKPVEEYGEDDTSIAVATIKYAKDGSVEDTDFVVKAVLGEDVLTLVDAIRYTTIDGLKSKKDIYKLLTETLEDPHEKILEEEKRRDEHAKQLKDKKLGKARTSSGGEEITALESPVDSDAIPESAAIPEPESADTPEMSVTSETAAADTSDAGPSVTGETSAISETPADGDATEILDDTKSSTSASTTDSTQSNSD